MITDREAASERVGAWLRQVVPDGLPVLGLCYGHQLLAHALGGEVGYNVRGEEIGTTRVHLTPAVATDPLFAHLPPALWVQQSHSQSVLRLPPGATHLAGNEHDPHQAFTLARAWGVQFHPEFGAALMREMIALDADALRAKGKDPEALLAAVTETPEAESLLRRFAAHLGSDSRLTVHRRGGL